MEVTQMVIHRIGPMSLAKLSGTLYAIIGLIIGAMMSLAAMAGAMASGGDNAGMFGAMFGIGAIVLVPLIYGCIGFIGSLIGAWLYNILAGMVGGVELDVT
jgi:hypothetical protein